MKTPIFIILIMAIIISSIAVIHLSTTTIDFSRYNPYWNGTSKFFELTHSLNVKESISTEELQGMNDTALLIISPVYNFSEDDAKNVRNFLREGNSLFIIDDFGTGNTLLSLLNSHISISTYAIAGVDRDYRDPASIIAYSVNASKITEGIEKVSFNRPSYLTGGEPLIETSLLSWPEIMNSSNHKRAGAIGRYTIFAKENYGKGEIFVLADPSIFINGMQNTLSNNQENQLIKKILTYRNKTIILSSNSGLSQSDGLIPIMEGIKRFDIYRAIILIFIPFICIIFMRLTNED